LDPSQSSRPIGAGGFLLEARRVGGGVSTPWPNGPGARWGCGPTGPMVWRGGPPARVTRLPSPSQPEAVGEFHGALAEAACGGKLARAPPPGQATAPDGIEHNLVLRKTAITEAKALHFAVLGSHQQSGRHADVVSALLETEVDLFARNSTAQWPRGLQRGRRSGMRCVWTAVVDRPAGLSRRRFVALCGLVMALCRWPWRST
jgi:hypothetical protein